MPRIALVTYAAAPDLTPDDRLLQAALRAQGAVADPVIWDADVDWTQYDIVLIRSTWDYFLRPQEFTAWVDRLEELGAFVLNPLPVIRWNGDKRYLLELQRAGIEIVPTTFLPVGAGGSPAALADILAAEGWTDAVVKPAVSGGAHDTWRTTAGTADADEERFRAVRSRASGGVLVQPFVGEITRDGEWSLVFLDGAFSHAAVKRPRSGDFRVQQEHGGKYAAAAAPPGLVHDAARVVAAAAACAGVEPLDLAYARVDGVARYADGVARLVLMEIECLEPSLFFLHGAGAAERMAQSLVARHRVMDKHAAAG